MGSSSKGSVLNCGSGGGDNGSCGNELGVTDGLIVVVVDMIGGTIVGAWVVGLSSGIGEGLVLFVVGVNVTGVAAIAISEEEEEEGGGEALAGLAVIGIVVIVLSSST
jgi:hypothetical protein